MEKFRPLIKGQNIRIDNHTPGKPMAWDWPPDTKPDDVHLDKSLNGRVNNKIVKVRITLNNDNGVTKPKKCERKDQQWMAAYEKMRKEVKETLESNPKVKNQLINDIIASIKEIGPNKPKRAVKKALKRIAVHFDLSEEMFIQYEEFSKGTVAQFCDIKIEQLYYVGYGTDNAFYLGEGDGGTFSRRVCKNREEIK